MRKFLKCRVTIFLALFWVGLSVIGYMGKDNIYRGYTKDIKKTPYFVLVFEGIHDGIYPWQIGRTDVGGNPWENLPGGGTADNSGPAAPEPQPPETVESTETAQPQPPETVENTETVQPQPPADGGVEGEVVAPAEPEPPQPKEFLAVGDDYFDDAVFIGDSRTVGLRDYGGLDKATFYASTGLNVYDMWTQKFCEVDGVKMTLEEALSRRQFKKVYFQIGINEMGRGTVDTFMQTYTDSVEKFKQLQPDAIIYVQGIMRVAKAKSDSDPIFNNPGIQVRNDRIRQLADNVRVFYIDMNEVVCDNTGNLKAELTFDNLHLYGSKYNIWVDFLKTKGIALE